MDNELVINEWYEHPAKTVSAQKAMEAGLHWMEVEYYENGGLAVVQLSWMPISPSVATWHASYWNNTTQAGTPALQRSEAVLDHDWGTGSPPNVVNDRFSARWTRYIDLSAGVYRFTATSDDGIRVCVDNELIINEWYDQSPQTYTAEKHLSTGPHWVVVEFYDNRGLAVAKLSWEVLSTPILNWQGEYFNNITLDGVPAMVRADEAIPFNWDGGSPAPGLINPDQFSVRWTRTLNLPTGRYRFVMTVDDGGRLWVNNRLLIEAWHDQAATTYTGDIYLPGGANPDRDGIL